MSTTEVNSKFGSRSCHVCPHQHVGLIDNFIRPMIHNPKKLFSTYVNPGMTVLDVGCGGGFASMGLAELVGDSGRVIAADLQPEMLATAKKRAIAKGLVNRIQFHQCAEEKIGLTEMVDFTLTFWMAHETPDEELFFNEIYSLIRPGGYYYITEPKFHVTKKSFQHVIKLLNQIGFVFVESPKVRFSQAAVFKKA